ncbi:hypothetical protein A2U01_0112946, partial [Trifolium medium]|nr:hypothetical protein [Trifolium medium]
CGPGATRRISYVSCFGFWFLRGAQGGAVQRAVY